MLCWLACDRTQSFAAATSACNARAPRSGGPQICQGTLVACTRATLICYCCACACTCEWLRVHVRSIVRIRAHLIMLYADIFRWNVICATCPRTAHNVIARLGDVGRPDTAHRTAGAERMPVFNASRVFLLLFVLSCSVLPACRILHGSSRARAPARVKYRYYNWRFPIIVCSSAMCDAVHPIRVQHMWTPARTYTHTHTHQLYIPSRREFPHMIIQTLEPDKRAHKPAGSLVHLRPIRR